MVNENARKTNRENALKKLEEHRKKGLVDEDVIFLLELINAYPFMYTTSSCSGRIVLMYVPPSEKKYECERIGKRHYEVSEDVVVDSLRKRLEDRRREGYVILKQEPPIIDIAVKDMESAQKLLSAGRAAGFKNSGIKSYNPKRGYEALVELWSTERLDVPVARPDYVVPEEYLRRVVRLANKKLLRSKLKLQRLYELILEVFGPPDRYRAP